MKKKYMGAPTFKIVLCNNDDVLKVSGNGDCFGTLNDKWFNGDDL